MTRKGLALAAALLLAQNAPVTAQDVKETGAIESQTPTGGSSGSKDKGQAQPQGAAGPTNTASGGARPNNPQGEAPPGMQVEKSSGEGAAKK